MNPFFCTLYNCKSKNKLQKYLYIQDKNNFKKLGITLKKDPLQLYSPFKQKGRELFKCSSLISRLHKRLLKLFNMPNPSYLKSGIKKESNITNVKFHNGSNFFLLIDIKSFYPSITKSKIKTQLIRTYKQSVDVAEYISNLVTVPQEKGLGDRALVTGSPLSQYFAYVINKKMFDELDSISKENNITFSVYVDDITFSSKQIITYSFHTKVYSIIKKYGYQVHNGKVYRGKIGNKSKITGIQITKYGFRLLDKHKCYIRDITHSKDCKKQIKRLLGLVNYAIQVNPRYRRYMSKINKSPIELSSPPSTAKKHSL